MPDEARKSRVMVVVVGGHSLHMASLVADTLRGAGHVVALNSKYKEENTEGDVQAQLEKAISEIALRDIKLALPNFDDFSVPAPTTSIEGWSLEASILPVMNPHTERYNLPVIDRSPLNARAPPGWTIKPTCRLVS